VAGQGPDLLDVLADHRRRDDVRARLVELDSRNTALAEERVRATGLDGLEVVTADASLSDHYHGMVPADLVLICWGVRNIADDDIEQPSLLPAVMLHRRLCHLDAQSADAQTGCR